MNDKDHLQLLSEGRSYVRVEAPYFVQALMGLIPVPVGDRVPTCAVTKGMVFYYNEKYIESLTVKQVATRQWHELQHVLRFSNDRMPGADPDKSNLASDLAINGSGLEGAWDFEPDGCLPTNFNLPLGLTMEEYYHQLPDEPKSNKGGGHEKGCGSGKCGGVAGNSKDQELESALDAEYGRSELDKLSIKKSVAAAIRSHAKKAGKFPGGWEEWADVVLAPPKVRWEDKFNNVVRDCRDKLESGRDDYSLSRISKRTYMIPNGAIRPSMIRYQVEVALVLDTSGSMDMEADIKPALREARGAILGAGAEHCWFLQVDAALNCKPIRATTRNLLGLKIHGRGGTNFCPAFVEAVKLRPKPQLLIYFTDGCGPAPAKPPMGMEVIWCLMGKHRTVPTTWGRVIHVEN